ncbi:hypothetical protein [Janthinobacterium psychrotolerans]|uniref:hypothetical protein n=1 Tax=Janthinobacterium psychrotolerans TaxID=1747903 RepID=UPI0014959911|nr:hypothetical protein [Janthinobacterium psychrotolerans]
MVGSVPAAVSVSLLDANGAASNTVSATAALTARAVVLDKSGAPVANALVTFTTPASLVTLTPAVGTALTDAKGVAVVTLRPADPAASGAGKVTATVTQGAVIVSGEANYQVAAAAASKASISVSLLNASGSNSNTLSSATPLTGVALVKDQNGAVLANAMVVFATSNETLAILAPANGTVLTDRNGEARVTLRPFSLAAAGAGTLTAAVVLNGTTTTSTINYMVGATALAFGNIIFEAPSLDAYGSTQVALDVMSNGVKYTDQSIAVNFSSTCVAAGKATFATLVQTADGTARATYRDRGCGANDVISATASGVTGSRSATLAIAPPQPASIQFTSAIPSDKAIVIRGQGGLLRSETATLKFRAFDTFNNPLQGLKVTFEKADVNAPVDLAPDLASTDANGEVTTSVSSRDTPLSFRIRAKFTTAAGREISTLSDTIVVSTGTPVQKAFSLSISDSNVEGLNVDANGSAPSATVNVAMGDKFGNPVADGTPVVFQSNVGVVGSASRGGCTSVNGACSVDFRSQEPRSPVPNTPATVCNRVASDSTRAGVGTICASTSDGTAVPIFDSISFFISGSEPGRVLRDDAVVLTKNVVNDLGIASWTVPKVFTLRVSDVNGNPMPSGTRIEVANISNAASSGVSPPAVQKIFPDSTVANDVDQGTRHIVTVSAPADNCSPRTATFNVNVISPRLLTTSYPFKLTFTCQ